jgi:hypothetical protein
MSQRITNDNFRKPTNAARRYCQNKNNYNNSIIMSTPAVNFKETVRVKCIRSITNTSDQELDARWYSREDFRAMQKRDVFIQRKLSKKEGVYHENDFFIHGLETENHRTLRKFNINRSRLTLLMEQEKWKQSDSNLSLDSMEVLAEVYSSATLGSRRLARKRGIATAEHVVQGNIKSATCQDDIRQKHPHIICAPIHHSDAAAMDSQSCIKKDRLETFQTLHFLKASTSHIRTRASSPAAHQRRSLRMMTNSPCGRR